MAFNITSLCVVLIHPDNVIMCLWKLQLSLFLLSTTLDFEILYRSFYRVWFCGSCDKTLVLCRRNVAIPAPEMDLKHVKTLTLNAMSILIPLQTCTTVEKRSQWSSPRPSHVLTVAGWATQRSPCRSTWLQSTQRPPQKWYVGAEASHTQPSMKPWLDVCADLNNRKHLHFCWFFLACLRISSQLSKLHPLLRTSLTLEEPVGFESMLSRVYILFAVLVLMSASDSVRKPNCNWCQVDCAALFIEAPCFSSDSKKTLVWTAEKYFVHVL